MSNVPTDDISGEIIDYLNSLRDVPIPDELEELAGMSPTDRLLSSAPGFAELVGQEQGEPAPAPVPGQSRAVKLPEMPDDAALKRKAVELLGLDPAILEGPEVPPGPEPDEEGEEGPPVEPLEAPPEPPAQPPAEPQADEPQADPAVNDAIARLTEKVNELLAYLRLCREIDPPTPRESTRERD